VGVETVEAREDAAVIELCQDLVVQPGDKRRVIVEGKG